MDSSCNDITFSQITSHALLRLIIAIIQKFFLSRFWILIRPRDMKCAAAIVFISVAFASQVFAVLRPLFPAKAAPPFNGELIVTGNGNLWSVFENASQCDPSASSSTTAAAAGYSAKPSATRLTCHGGSELPSQPGEMWATLPVPGQG